MASEFGSTITKAITARKMAPYRTAGKGLIAAFNKKSPMAPYRAAGGSLINAARKMGVTGSVFGAAKGQLGAKKSISKLVSPMQKLLMKAR